MRRGAGWCLFFLVACGGSETGNSPTDAAPLTDANLVDGPLPPPTETASCTIDADCGTSTCVEVIDGGYKACSTPVNPATMATTSANDECPTPNCTTGTCFERCQLVQGIPAPVNRCLVDECQSDGDCSAQPNGVCVPAGVLFASASTCTYGNCISDAGCTASSGGRCTPFLNACADVLGFFCSYDTSPCRTTEDCVDGGFCQPDGNGDTICSMTP